MKREARRVQGWVVGRGGVGVSFFGGDLLLLGLGRFALFVARKFREFICVLPGSL